MAQGGGHPVCLIMKNCVLRLISDSPIIRRFLEDVRTTSRKVLFKRGPIIKLANRS